MKWKINDDFLITVIYILSGVMMVGQFLGIHFITSIAYALSFVFVWGVWALHLKKCRIIDILSMIIIGMSFLSVIITCSDISTTYFLNWIIFSSVFVYFSVCLKIKIQFKTFRRLFLINSIVVLFCCMAYVVRYNTAFYVTNTGIKYLKFDFYNPNCLALFLFCIALVEILNKFVSQKWYLLKQGFIIVLFSILIAQTLSRTVLIAFAFFVIIFVIFKRKKKYFLPSSMVFNSFVAVFPLIFAFAYMILIENVINNGLFKFLITEGKGLDSRQLVWDYAFELIKKSPFIGSYGDILESTMFSQMHNSHLNVLASYGIFAFALVVVFLIFVLREASINSKESNMELSVWAFIICLLLGSGEAILFSGGLSFYLLVGQFLLFTNVQTESEGGLMCDVAFEK